MPPLREQQGEKEQLVHRRLPERLGDTTCWMFEQFYSVFQRSKTILIRLWSQKDGSIVELAETGIFDISQIGNV